MEVKTIREEADILPRLFRLKKLDGITNEEWQKMLSTTSDETILEVAKFGYYSQEASEILMERMRKWPTDRVLKAIKKDEWRLSELADKVLVERMTKWTKADLEKAMQDENLIIVTAALEAEKRKKEIGQLREKLGLKPLP